MKIFGRIAMLAFVGACSLITGGCVASYSQSPTGYYQATPAYNTGYNSTPYYQHSSPYYQPGYYQPAQTYPSSSVTIGLPSSVVIGGTDRRYRNSY